MSDGRRGKDCNTMSRVEGRRIEVEGDSRDRKAFRFILLLLVGLLYGGDRKVKGRESVPGRKRGGMRPGHQVCRLFRHFPEP